MKDECAGTPIVEFVGLWQKTYSILRAAGAEERKVKGGKKCVGKKHIRHAQYKEALNGKLFHHGMDIPCSHGHQVYRLHENKVSLSPLDTKKGGSQLRGSPH